MAGVTATGDGATSDPRAIDARHFREVLGHFPTGVVVVTAVAPDGTPVGMAVGSFSSVSIDPPMVVFYPDKRSRSWPLIRAAGSFCVNVLGADQEVVCRTFAASGTDKFRDVTWRPAGSGAPVLDQVLAWIDCDLEAVHEAGDHDLVLGRVRALGVEHRSLPLVFFRGGYGRFLPLSLAAAAADLAAHLPVVDRARGEMERLAAELGVECVAAAVSGEELVFLASAGRPQDDSEPTWVGLRVPFAPPIGGVLVAWAEPLAIDSWLAGLEPDLVAELRALLHQIRRSGYSVGLRDPAHDTLTASVEMLSRLAGDAQLRAAARSRVDELGARFELLEAAPGVRYDLGRISAPIFDRNGRVALALNLHGLPPGMDAARIHRFAAALTTATARVTAAIGGRGPDVAPSTAESR